jgi:hypothetical protein
MKSVNLKWAVVSLCCFSLIATSCKKNTSNNDATVDESTQARVHSDDATTVSTETESVDDDVNNTVASSARFCGLGNVFGIGNHLPYDADTSNPGNTANRIIITYNGTTIGCRKRTGTVTIDLLNAPKWVEAGAILKYTFTNFKVENVCTNRSVRINGERYVTNVNGGNLVRLKAGLVPMLKHKIRTGVIGLEATFTDSSGSKTAVWNVARLTTITYATNNNSYYLDAAGDTTIANKPATESWGTTRFGNPYQTVFTAPVKANTFCRLWKPTAGVVTHSVGNYNALVEFGLNASGNPVGPNDCATHYRVTWTLANGTNSTPKLIEYK